MGGKKRAKINNASFIDLTSSLSGSEYTPGALEIWKEVVEKEKARKEALPVENA